MPFHKRRKQHLTALSYKPLATLLITVFLSTTSCLTLSLPKDSQQPINIKSDHLAIRKILKDGSEKIEYFGGVVITQGSISINGEHITILSKDRQVLKINAIGKPARFQQQPDPTKSPMKAKASSIQYQLSKDTIVLANNAMIEQEGSTVSGDHIEYNISSEKIDAKRGADYDSRVHMVLKPTDKKDPKQTQ